jgi:hypothetical protein
MCRAAGLAGGTGAKLGVAGKAHEVRQQFAPNRSFRFQDKNGRRSVTMTVKKATLLASPGIHALHIHGTTPGRDTEAAETPIWKIKHNRVRLT